jgi:putative SOS response-associated peptidase YedK
MSAVPRRNPVRPARTLLTWRRQINDNRGETLKVVLDPADWPAWLGEVEAGLDELKVLLRPYPSDRLTMWPVSKAVNNVRNEDAELVTRMNSA